MGWLKRAIGGAVLVTIGALGWVSVGAWQDAANMSDELKARVEALNASGQSMADLSESQRALLLLAQDPGYFDHNGVDLSSPGVGLTTMTQALSKRLAFDEFKPGVSKLRQTIFAISLEKQLTKQEIFTLFLDEVHLGRFDGEWTTGIFNAAERLYDKSVPELSDQEFTLLVAVMIAPGKLSAETPGAELTERVRRIRALYAGECEPTGPRDVWLEGCA